MGVSRHMLRQEGQRVRILVTGASGLIGSAILSRLAGAGYETVAVVHRPSDRPMAAAKVVVLDVARAGEDDWARALDGVTAVVNAAGVLQDGLRDSTAGVHVEGAARLFGACVRAGIARVIHVSAMGADGGAQTAFLRTKRAGDGALMETPLDWAILRPSVVVGKAAYGGSALFRALAALPFAPRIRDAGPLQVVQVEEIAETVLALLEPDAPRRVTLEIGGPEPLALGEVVAAYRRWLGWAPQRELAIPGWLMGLCYRAGDLMGWLGWRPPVRSTVRAEIARGSVGDTAPWRALTGISPRALPDALVATPPSVQERWFAQLYLLKPVVFGMLSLFWIATGLVALGPGWEAATLQMRAAGLEATAAAAVVAGSLADIVIGIGIALRHTARRALHAGIALSLAYLAAGTILAPGLWSDPLGPLLKIAPVIMLMAVALAIREDR